MDFHALSRRDLQALAKRNGVKANQTNAAMADALAALTVVDGIEEYVQQPVAEPASAAKPSVQAVVDEDEKAPPEELEKEAAAEEEEHVAHTPDEAIVLDDGEEEEQKEPTVAIGRRRATRRAPVEPVAAPPAASKRAAARKTEKGDAAAEAVPAQATRGRSQRTVAEEEAPKAARRTSRRTVARNTSTEQEKGTQADVSHVEAAAPAPVVMDAHNEEQFAAAEAQKEDTAAEAIPAQTTRGRRQRTPVSAAEDEAPKARRTSKRAAARKTGTEQEEEEGTKESLGVSEVEAAVPAQASSDEGDDGAAKMEAATEAQSEEQYAASEAEKGDASGQVVPAPATRAGRRRTVVSFAEDAVPKTRRTSRRANGDISDMEPAAPAPVASDKLDDGAVVSEVAANAHNEEQNEPVEQPVEAEPRLAVPAWTTRARSEKVVSFADEEAPKSRRTSRRAVARKTSTEQEVEEKGAQGDVSDMRAVVPAPASSHEGGDGAEEIEATIDAQKEEQFAVAEAVPARATRARRQRTVVSLAVEEAPKARRTSRRTGTMQEEEGQVQQQQQDIASDVEAVVPAPVSSHEGGDGAEETEVGMEPQNKEQNELVEEQRDEYEGAVADRTPPLEEGEPMAEDCTVDSSVEEQTDTVSSEEIQHSSEDKAMVPAEVVDFTGDDSDEKEDAEEKPAMEEHVDSSEQEHLVDVQQCAATEEIQLASEDAEMLPVDEARQATVTSGEATVEADFTSDADHASEENEDCTAEEEPPVEEHVASTLQEPLVDVQQCEATEDASEDAERVPVDEVPQATHTSDEATQEADHTSDADHDSEENEDCTVEDETPVGDDFDSSVQELTVEVQQCEATEDTEMVHVNEVLQATLKSGEVVEEVDANDAEEVNEVLPTSEEVLQSAAKASESKEDIADDEVTNNTDVAAEEETVHASEENEVPNPEEVLQSAAKANKEKKEDMVAVEVHQRAAKASESKEDIADDEVTNNTDVAAEEENEVPNPEEVLQSAAKANNEKKEYMVAVEVHQRAAKASESKEDIADDEVTNNTDVAAEEETVHTSEENEVPNPEEVLQSAAKANKEKEDMVAVEVQQWSEAMYEDVVEVVAVDKDESGFVADLTDVFMDEEAAVGADEMLQSSATMEENVEKSITVEKLSQVTETDDEWAVTLGAWLQNLSQARVSEEAAVGADEMTQSSTTMEGNVEKAITVEKLQQVTETDDEWAVTLGAWLENLSQARVSEKEVVTVEEVTAVGNLSQGAANIAGEPVANVASPQSANVFEDAARSLSMDSISAEPTVSEPADVPLCGYSHTIRKMKITEPMSVQREKEVKLTKKPEALDSISVRKLKLKLKADDGSLCIYSNSGDENSTSQAQESEALGSLSLRKLRTEFNEIVAVAQENEVVKEVKKSSTPLDTLSLRQLRLKLRDTLNAQTQKNKEPTRVPLGRLDKNAY